MGKFREYLEEQYNLFPIKNKGKSFKNLNNMTNVLIDLLEKKFGKIFSKKSTGLTPNSKSFQFDLKSGKESKFDEVCKFIEEELKK